MPMRRLIFAAAVIPGVIFLSGCMNTNITNIASLGKNIVCFGDSITQGFGADPKDAYPAHLAKLISIPVVNSGIEGDTSEGALKRIKPDVLDRAPLLVIVELGANDFLTKIPMEYTRRNLEEIIVQIQKQGAMVALADVSNAHFMTEYGPMFKSLCRQYKAIYIPDLLGGILANPGLKSDYFHPNAAGYKIISQRVYRTVLPCVNQNTILRRFKR